MRINALKKFLFLGVCFLAGCGVPPPITTPIVLSPHQMIVQPGDTLYGIALRYDVSLKKLMQLNHLTSSHIQPGQILAIPETDFSAKARDASQESAIAQTDIQPLSPSLQEDAASGGMDPQIAKEIAQAARPQAIVGETGVGVMGLGASGINAGVDSVGGGVNSGGVKPFVATTAGSSAFIWPIKGDVISKFTQEAAKRSDGIKIKGVRGEPVKASRAGTVLVAQKNFESLGNVLIVKSPDGTLTAYGHLDAFKASKGQTIQQHDIVGTVGKSGHLYFEVRQILKPGGKPQPVNPVPLLSGS